MFLSLAVAFLVFCPGVSYSAEDDSRRAQEHMSQMQRQQAIQQTQSQGPILPPATPSPSPLSPTPSPHIAAPPVASGPINMPPAAATDLPKPVIYNVPSTPAYTQVPVTSMPTEQIGVPMAGIAMGKITDIREEPSGAIRIEIIDELVNTRLKIKIDPRNTVIVKDNNTINYKGLEINNTVYVNFDQWGDETTANLINVVTDDKN